MRGLKFTLLAAVPPAHPTAEKKFISEISTWPYLHVCIILTS